MKKLTNILIAFFFIGVFPTYEYNGSKFEITLHSSNRLLAGNDVRGYTEQHEMHIIDEQSMVTDDGYCLRVVHEWYTYESCSPGLEPCGANHHLY